MDTQEFRQHCQDLFQSLGVADLTDVSRIAVTGSDPVLASPHKLGTAAAIAASVQGGLIDAIWRARGGRPQSVSVDIRSAVMTLNSSAFLLQGAYPVGMGFGYHEPLNRFYRAQDRWFRFVGSRPSHRDAILHALSCSNTPADLAAAIAKRDAFELEEECARLGVPGVAVRTRAEWRAHSHGRSLAARPVVEVRRVGDGAAECLSPAARPLAGVRVLDLTHVLAGPASTRTLAAQGAHVLRITPPTPGQDPLYMAMDTGFGKRNAYLDLRRPQDQAKAKELAAQADIVVQSYRNESLDKFGLGMEELVEQRPGLIYVSISCYGEGPWESRAGFDPNAVAVTGIAMDEARDGVPSLPPTTLLADYLTGYLAASGIAAALLLRSVEGGSYHVKLSLARSAMWVQDFGLLPLDAYSGMPAALEKSVPLMTMATPFGPLSYVKPIPVYSDTPAYWSSPPLPLGEAAPSWGLW